MVLGSRVGAGSCGICCSHIKWRPDIDMRFNEPPLCPCFVLLRTRCYRLDCGRRTRRRKLPQGRSRETTCWPTWRNRPRSIRIKKTWCRSRGRREVGAFLFVLSSSFGFLTHFKLQLNVTKRRDVSSMWVLSSGRTHTRRVFEKL